MSLTELEREVGRMVLQAPVDPNGLSFTEEIEFNRLKAEYREYQRTEDAYLAAAVNAHTRRGKAEPADVLVV